MSESGEPSELAGTVEAMQLMVPARDFELSKRFYMDIAFRPQGLTDGLTETLGTYSFISRRCRTPGRSAWRYGCSSVAITR
jgi:hypothetical protein